MNEKGEKYNGEENKDGREQLKEENENDIEKDVTPTPKKIHEEKPKEDDMTTQTEHPKGST